MDCRRLVCWPGLTGLAMLGALAFVPVAAEASPPCTVVAGGVRYPTLQPAVEAAAAGSTLTVEGTCYGDASISKQVRIVGRSNRRLGQATLNGGTAPPTRAA